jgi:hypothetical protein
MLMTRVSVVDRSEGRDEPPTPRRWPSGVSFAVAVGCCAPVALLAWLAGAAVHPLAGLVLFAGAAAGLAAVSSGLGAVGAALLMWAGDDGFVIHRFGVLSLDDPSVRALAVIGSAAVAAYGAAGLARRLRRPGSRG